MTPYQIACLACWLAQVEATREAANGECRIVDAAAYIPEAITLYRAAEAQVNCEAQEA